MLLHKVHGNAGRHHGDVIADFVCLCEDDVVVVGLTDGDHGSHFDPRLSVSEARKEKRRRGAKLQKRFVHHRDTEIEEKRFLWFQEPAKPGTGGQVP